MTNVALEEYELLGDAKYRSYVSAVDKALKSFEYTSEWADLISALGKLNKVLLNNIKYPVIPRRITISKRLAQCMHPALPSGVHLKALETYDIIFKCTGPSRLSQELFIYSAGLFPLLGHAAMNVKPALLSIYETHFVPLKEKLRPGLNGFLVGILPGLEEGSDHYERTDALLMKVSEGVEKSYFYGCLWKCVLCNPSIRLAAITFVISHYNKKVSMEDQLYIIGTDIDAMVQALCASLQDSSVLVQRSALELLLLGFPLNNCQLVPDDRIRIMTAAVVVLLRRDMSLNRRLYGWLFGQDNTALPNNPENNLETSDITSSRTCNYFETHASFLLLEALRSIFSTSGATCDIGFSSSTSALWPYRILISLMDRPEINTSILDSVLIDVFRSLYHECSKKSFSSKTSDLFQEKNSCEKGSNELVKTANLFFTSLEPSYLWSYMSRLFNKSCKLAEEEYKVHSERKNDSNEEIVLLVGKGTPSIKELCALVEFLLEVVSLEAYIETPTEHLPDLLFKISVDLVAYCPVLTSSELNNSLKLCSKLLSKVQPTLVNMAAEEEDMLEVPSNSPDIGAMEDKKEHSDNANTSPTHTLPLDFKIVKAYDPSSPSKNKEFPRAATVVSSCMESFQNLFLKFVESRILAEPEKVLDDFYNIMVQKRVTPKEREQNLNNLLEQCLLEKPLKDPTKISFPRILKKDDNFEAEEVTATIKLLPSFSDLKEAYSSLCHLIVELSSFPTYLTNSRKVLESNKTEASVPNWLKHLLMLSCFMEQQVLMSTMSTALDLIALSCTTVLTLKSAGDRIAGFSASSSGGSANTVSMLVMPMIKPSELQYIMEETKFIPIATARLWNLLHTDNPNVHLRTVELLQQLHNLAPDDGICENVLCRTLTSEDEQEQVEAQKKFCILWHLSRDLKFKSTPSSMVRSFDRCLFQMLDCLSKKTGPQKAVSKVWLNHALQRGDLARLLEPIMLILLHPDTARVSIQHVSVHQPKKVVTSETTSQEESTSEGKIFAISSVGGNVIYHVSNETKQSVVHYNSPDKKILALTSLVGSDKGSGSKFVTSSSAVQDYEMPSGYETHHPISVFVNPFGSLTSLSSDFLPDTYETPDFSNATRIDTTTRKSSFDDIGEMSSFESTEMTGLEIVGSILDELIMLATVERDFASDILVDTCDFGLDLVFKENKDDWTDSNKADKKDGNPPSKEFPVHPLHTHLLLYCQVFDSEKTLYTLSVLKSIIETNPRVALCNMTTTSISSSLSKRGTVLQMLLARHRKSVFGNNFHGDLTADALTGYRSSMYLEVLVSASFYFIRSYYPNLPQGHLTVKEIAGNRNVRLLCCDILGLIFRELVDIVKDSGKSFAVYLNDLLTRCKVQKALLHCLVASVFGFQTKKLLEDEKASSITSNIINFNEKPCYNEQSDTLEMDNDFQETFQIYMLNLLSSLLILEDKVIAQTGGEDAHSTNVLKNSERVHKIRFQPHMSALKYHPNVTIPCQPMFGTATLTALRQYHKAHLHSHWLNVVMTALPFAGRNLTQLVLSVASQLCCNLENVVSSFDKDNKDQWTIPPDYLITLVEGLSLLCHYCLLDSAVPISTPVNQPPFPPAPSTSSVPGANASQIISNLIHVFSAIDSQKDLGARESTGAIDPILSTRRSLLSNLPRLLAALVSVWEGVSRAEKDMPHKLQPLWIMGSPKVVKQHILSFLSPVSLNYGSNFMAAVAVVWYERRRKTPAAQRKVLPQWTADQLLLVELVSAIKVLPMDSVVQVVRQVIRQPPPTSNDKKKRVPLEVSMLQFFLAYAQHTPGNQLLESWNSLLGLWKDGLQLTSLPPVQFHLLVLLHEFVQKAPLLEDKKDQKDLQDISQKVIEACSTVASASLEQTTWLRKNLAVRPGPQPDILDSDLDGEEQGVNPELKCIVNGGAVPQTHTVNYNGSSHSQYSVQALFVLAEFLAPVLDVVYVSEEKEKVVPLLANIMYYVTPYLKNHSSHNIPSFRACSQLLASISSYQYTRKAWKRDALELLLDPVFFQMDYSCIAHWRSIVDHLMTHDKTTFRDFMTRVSITQSGSLNIFTSKEQEYESRAQLLKRLAFVLFCSEADQYQRYMPDIQERLAESLRLTQVPSVQAQVFLCFRVLLLRMSPQHVTSLWPGIITELVQAFLQIEQELSTDTEEFRLQILDSSWVTSSSNGLNAHNHPAWLQLYLSACKLLDMAVALPAEMLPQFQMYRWAFIGDNAPLSSDGTKPPRNNSNSRDSEFVPHIMRLAALMNKKSPSDERLMYHPGRPLLTLTSIHSLQQLQSFFNTLMDITRNPSQVGNCQTSQHSSTRPKSSILTSQLSKSRSAPELNAEPGTSSGISFEENGAKTALQYIERILESDFLEPRQS